MSLQKGRSWIWPSITDEKSAKDASAQGAVASGFISFFSGFIGFVMSMGWDQGALREAFLFAILGFGIFRLSRTAAVVGLALYFVEWIYMWPKVGIINVALTPIVVLMFVNSIRGTFVYHQIKKQARNFQNKEMSDILPPDMK